MTKLHFKIPECILGTLGTLRNEEFWSNDNISYHTTLNKNNNNNLVHAQTDNPLEFLLCSCFALTEITMSFSELL